MFVLAGARRLTAAVAIALLAGCTAAQQLTPGQTAAQSIVRAAGVTQTPARAGFLPLFANPKLNELAAARPASPGREPGTFVVHSPPKPGQSLLIASSEYGYIFVYDAASGALDAACHPCGGWGVSVNKKNGDFAVGGQYSTVAVYSPTKYFATSAELTLPGSSGLSPVGLAYDNKGGLYVSVLQSNAIAYFSAQTIAAGGGKPDLELYPPDLLQAFFLTTDGNTLIADGVSASGESIETVSIKQTKHGTTDTILQSAPYGTVFPGGLAVDKYHNLTIDNQYGTTATYAPPWTGAPVRSLDWYDGGYSDYTAIALSKDQQTLYSANVIGSESATDVVYGTYDPLGEFGSTDPLTSQVFIGVGIDPATTN